MKKIFAILMAAMLVMALSVSAFAAETVVFDNPDGESWEDCVNSWDFFGVGGFWGREAANALDISIEDLVALFEDGNYTFTYVCGGAPGYNNGGVPAGVVNGDFDNGANCTVTELGDGKYEVSVKLSDVLAAAGVSADSVENFVIQISFDDFVLYSAKFTTEAPAPAPDGDDDADADDDGDNGDDGDDGDNTPPADTGIVLAVVPAVVAMAAVAVSKKH